MSSSFSESNLIKKLQHVTNTQDSIQTLSLWVLHHKTHYRLIIEHWLKCFLKAKTTHQLALFYLANDIVQHARRKSLAHFISEFMGALREATKVTNDPKNVSSINRVLNIWQERNIYSKEFIDELRELLCGEDVKLEVLSKIVSDFSSNEIIAEINNTTKVEQLTKSKLQNLVNCKVDFANSELLNKLKDKSYGEQFSTEFDEATKCLDSVIGALEKEITCREELIAKLDKARLFYEVQIKEANTVAEAFNNCEIRVNQVKVLLNKFSNSQSTSLVSEGITTSQLSSVINLIQQAQNANSNSMSSLDQRLSLMSTSGQFGLALNPDNQAFGQVYDPSYQSVYNPNAYADQFYMPQDGSQGNQIESLTGSRNEPGENMEPADMDLGDSDDDDYGAKKTMDMNHKNHTEDKMKRRPVEIPFLNPPDLSGLFPLIPPPPPPPLPPPALKDLFVQPPSLEEDPFYHALSGMPGMDSNHLQGNSIRNIADRQNRNSTSYHHSNHASNNSWRNSSDNRQSTRNQSYNPPQHNPNHSNRWKNNHSRGPGTFKRNSYGSQH